MELLYVWIDEYKNISKQGINFSPEFHFTYDHEKDELDFEKIDGLPKDFWGENVMNLTLLLGKNGAGKTSILEYLYKPYLKPIFIFRENLNSDSLLIYKNANYLKSTKINEIGTNTGFKIHYDRPSSSKFEDYFDGMCRVYYNPIFRGDGRKIDQYLQQSASRSNGIELPHFDISQDVLLYKSILDDKNPPINANNLFHKYNKSETCGHLMFLRLDEKFFSMIFHSGTPSIEISKRYKYLKVYQLNADVVETFDRLLARKKAMAEDNHSNKTSKSKNTLINLFFTNCMIGHIIELTDLISTVDFHHEKVTYLEEYCSNPDFEDINNFDLVACYHGLLKLFDKYINHFNDERLRSHFNSVKEKIETIDIPSYIKKISLKYVDYIETGNGDVIIYRPNNFKEFKEFEPLQWFDTLDYSSSNVSIFDFRWTGLSNGQLFRLTLFGRIYNNIRYALLAERHIHTILFCLDEGETTLHPHWQKQYIKWITEYIRMMFPEKKIQFILATNNPIIASDVPSSNIIKLKPDEKSNARVVETNSKTFGANIYDLLKDDFFIEDGFMGEFAKTKIDETISWLNNTSRDLSKSNDILRIINTIGERFIYQKLLEKYEEVTGQNARLLTIQRKIKELQEEELKLKLQKRNNL